MSYYDTQNAVPYNVIQDFGASDNIVKQSKPKPFDKSPFASVIYRNTSNLPKDNYYDVDYKEGKMKPTRGIIPHKKGDISGYFKGSVAFDNTPFNKVINDKANYYHVRGTRLSLNEYTALIQGEAAKLAQATQLEIQQAQMFLPTILKKITMHSKLVQEGVLPGSSKPNFTEAEKAYLNMIGNLSPEQLFLKMKALSGIQDKVEEEEEKKEEEEKEVVIVEDQTKPEEEKSEEAGDVNIDKFLEGNEYVISHSGLEGATVKDKQSYLRKILLKTVGTTKVYYTDDAGRGKSTTSVAKVYSFLNPRATSVTDKVLVIDKSSKRAELVNEGDMMGDIEEF